MARRNEPLHCTRAGWHGQTVQMAGLVVRLRLDFGSCRPA
jgi:hypothetical protein